MSIPQDGFYLEILLIFREDKVLDVDQADDIILVVLIYGESGVHGFLECRHDFTESGIDVHGHHVDPGNHDVLGQGIREIEYIVNHFPLFRFDNAVRMADFHIGAQLGLCHGGNLLTGVNVQYAEDAV